MALKKLVSERLILSPFHSIVPYTEHVVDTSSYSKTQLQILVRDAGGGVRVGFLPSPADMKQYVSINATVTVV